MPADIVCYCTAYVNIRDNRSILYPTDLWCRFSGFHSCVLLAAPRDLGSLPQQNHFGKPERIGEAAGVLHHLSPYGRSYDRTRCCPHSALGIVGAAIATTITYLASAALSVSWFHKVTKLRWTELIVPRPSDLTTLVNRTYALISGWKR